MDIETINSVRGDSVLKPLKSINNKRTAYMFIVPLHITVWKHYDDKHQNIVRIYGFGKNIFLNEPIEGLEHLGRVDTISYLKDNKFIITFVNENQ